MSTDPRTGTKSALLLIDCQNDFCEGGALAVQGGHEVVRHVAKYLDEPGTANRYSLVVATQDWHIDPGDHWSSEPNFIDSWPEHCAAGTQGAELAEPLASVFTRLRRQAPDRFFYCRKGEYAAAYSGFEGEVLINGSADENGFDTAAQAGLATRSGQPDQPSEQSDRDDLIGPGPDKVLLGDFLRSQAVTSVDICGLATDYCVAASAADALSQGLEVHLLADFCAGINANRAKHLLGQLAAQGMQTD